MRSITCFHLVLIFSITGYAQGTFQKNLLDVSHWSENLGVVSTAGDFTAFGGPTPNSIIWDTGPFGRKALVWKCTSAGNNGPNGGWEYRNIPISDKKAYRLTVWMKKVSASTTGNLYLGCEWNTTLNLDGTPNTNPYFGYFPQSDPRFKVGRWYLWVGYLHATIDPDLQSYGGIYDGITGQKIINLIDLKIEPGATVQTHRSYNFYDVTVGSVIKWYGPRFEEINGSEPTVEQLLGVLGRGSTVATNAYLGGKLSIGTISNNDPEFNLFVENGIRTRKVKVDQATWPDYVFEEDYELPAINQLENYIDQNEHLPGIPTSKEISANGLDLGEMNKMLLQKIEELTLYIIHLNDRIEELEKK